MKTAKEAFPLPLRTEALRGGKLWELLEPFEYHSDKYGTIRIPTGFVGDFASIPRLVWSIIGSPATGKYRFASWPHDYLYVNQTVSRSKADRIFLEAMRVLGVSWWKRRIMWLAVRIGGWRPWHRYRRKLRK